MHSTVTKQTGFVALMIVQIVFLVLYWVFVRYGKEASPIDKNPQDAGLNEQHESKYPREYWFKYFKVYIYKCIYIYKVHDGV